MASKNSQDYKKRNRRQNGSTRRKPYDKNIKGKDECVMDKKPGGNDPRWWGPKDYINAVASFNFSSPIGKPVPYDFYNDPASTVRYQRAGTYTLPSVPGIMAIDVLPTMGIGHDSNDAINQYVRNVFTKLRSTNNQSAPYQAPDLGMYIMAIDSVHMGIEQLIRMYGIARTYSAMNRYYPNAALHAMGINPEDRTWDYTNIYSNLADMRATILNLLIKIQTLAIPKGISICERHRELVKYIYKDGESVKSQAYVFRTPYLYKFNETYSSQGGGLNAIPMPIGQNWMQWVATIDGMINELTNSQFFAIVSGDIIKAFGYEGLYRMPFFEETYTVVPLFNPEILLEIHNLTVCGDRYSDTAFDITQDAGTCSLICTPYTTTAGDCPSGAVHPIIDVPVDNPDPDLVMVASRLAVCGSVGYISEDSKYKFTPSAVGSEIALRLTIYYYDANGSIQIAVTTSNVVNSFNEFRNWMMHELFFDWHPHIYYITYNSAHTQADFHTIVSELQNYTVMSPGDLMKMHEMAIYGALTMDGVETTGLK